MRHAAWSCSQGYAPQHTRVKRLRVVGLVQSSENVLDFVLSRHEEFFRLALVLHEQVDGAAITGFAETHQAALLCQELYGTLKHIGRGSAPRDPGWPP